MKVRWIFVGLLALGVVLSAACGGGQSEQGAASAALERGLAAHHAGNLEEAAQAYREVLVHDPQNKYAFYNLGLIDQTSGRLLAAENHYRLALSVEPNYDHALFNLAILRKAAGATQEAIELYRHVTAVQPNHAKAHFNLGLLLRSIGQSEEGDAEVQRGLQLDPSLTAAGTPGPVEPPEPEPTQAASPTP